MVEGRNGSFPQTKEESIKLEGLTIHVVKRTAEVSKGKGGSGGQPRRHATKILGCTEISIKEVTLDSSQKAHPTNPHPSDPVPLTLGFTRHLAHLIPSSIINSSGASPPLIPGFKLWLETKQQCSVGREVDYRLSVNKNYSG